MITSEDLKDPKIFSDFVQNMESGKTTVEEEATFEKYLESAERTLLDMAQTVIKSNGSQKL